MQRQAAYTNTGGLEDIVRLNRIGLAHPLMTSWRIVLLHKKVLITQYKFINTIF